MGWAQLPWEKCGRSSIAVLALAQRPFFARWTRQEHKSGSRIIRLVVEIPWFETFPISYHYLGENGRR